MCVLFSAASPVPNIVPGTLKQFISSCHMNGSLGQNCAILFRALEKGNKSPKNSLGIQNFRYAEAELLNQSFVWVDVLQPSLVTYTILCSSFNFDGFSASFLIWILPSSKDVAYVLPHGVIYIVVLHKYIFISWDCPLLNGKKVM